MPIKGKKSIARCPRCDGRIVWLQGARSHTELSWRGCINWVVCDYREPTLFSHAKDVVNTGEQVIGLNFTERNSDNDTLD